MIDIETLPSNEYLDELSPNRLEYVLRQEVLHLNPSLDLIQSLLDAGASPNTKGYLEHSALHFAVLCCHQEVIMLLVKNGANLESREIGGLTPLHLAAKHISCPYTISLELITSGADLEAKDIYGNAPLHLAAEKGNIDHVKILLKAGANIEAKNNFYDTPLHRAVCRSNGQDVVKALIAAGANQDARNKGGSTPWDLAPTEIRSAIPELDPDF